MRKLASGDKFKIPVRARRNGVYSSRSGKPVDDFLEKVLHTLPIPEKWMAHLIVNVVKE